MRALLGIDLGTTGLKATVYDLDGRLLGHGFAANRYLPAAPGHAEQDPRDWWAGCGAAVRAALAGAGIAPGDVLGVGVCGFHHCPVFLKEDGEPARPTIVTHDGRLGRSLAELAAGGVLDEVARLSGSRVLTGHLPPIYHYVRSHEPAALRDTRWLLLAKDYLRYRLTGVIGTEVCDASGTHLVAMPAPGWSTALCSLLHVPPECLPPIGAPAEVSGTVTPQAADETGLAAGTPVVHGGGDSHCALLGLGVLGAGQAGLLLGTNSTLRAAFGGPAPGDCPDQSVWAQQHVVPGVFTVSASSMAGSSALDWLAELLGVAAPGGDRGALLDELDGAAASVPPGCDGLLFHPYLYGERSPFYNPEARGAFLGLTHRHGRSHLVRAVMEGVAFNIAACLDVLRHVAARRGEEIAAIRCAESGGTRLPTWRRTIAAAIDRPLEVMAVEQPGCLGAALLAGVGVGVYADLASAAARGLPVAGRVRPDPAESALYAARRRVFGETFRAIEPVLYA